ncbi:hypothetical protein BJX64DRAFT_271119 [Aspergillus heterothallicus]
MLPQNSRQLPPRGMGHCGLIVRQHHGSCWLYVTVAWSWGFWSRAAWTKYLSSPVIDLRCGWVPAVTRSLICFKSLRKSGAHGHIYKDIVTRDCVLEANVYCIIWNIVICNPSDNLKLDIEMSQLCKGLQGHRLDQILLLVSSAGNIQISQFALVLLQQVPGVRMRQLMASLRTA